MTYNAADLAGLSPNDWIGLDLNAFFMEHSGRVVSELLAHIGSAAITGGVVERNDLVSMLYLEGMPRLSRALASNSHRVGGDRFKLLYGTLRSVSRTVVISQLPSITPVIGDSFEALMEQRDRFQLDSQPEFPPFHNSFSHSAPQFAASSILASNIDEMVSFIDGEEVVASEMLAYETLLGERLEMKRGELTTTQYRSLYETFFRSTPSVNDSDPVTPATLENIRCKLYRMVPPELRDDYQLLSVLPRRERSSYLQRALLAANTKRFNPDELSLLESVLVKMENPHNYTDTRADMAKTWLRIQALKSKILPLLTGCYAPANSFIPRCFSQYVDLYFPDFEAAVAELSSGNENISPLHSSSIVIPHLVRNSDLSSLPVRERKAVSAAAKDVLSVIRATPSRLLWRKSIIIGVLTSYMVLQGIA